MCGGGAPQDRSPEVAAIERDAQREQREYERQQAELAAQQKAQKDAADLAAFESRLNNAFTMGTGEAESFFRSRGLDPSQYSGDIMSAANQRRASVPQLSGEVGSYFSGLGESVYNNLTDALRNRSLRQLNEIAPEGFARQRIADTADDEIINSILADKRGEAEQYAQRLFDRGVVTSSGLAAARKDIGEQANRGQFTLQELGQGLLEGGRGDAINLANLGRSRASQLNLGDSYDPYATTGTELNTFFTDFLSNLGNRFRAQAPTDLFDISGLPVIAGAAQGAGNTKFDPQAVAGVIGEDEDEEEEDIFDGVF